MAFTVIAILIDPHTSQQDAGLHHGVWQPQLEVTRPKARFKPTLPKRSGVEGGQCDQIEQFLEFLGNKFYNKSNKNVW